MNSGRFYRNFIKKLPDRAQNLSISFMKLSLREEGFSG
jgi:hypothetical protein